MQKWEYRVTERKDIDISKRGELFNRLGHEGRELILITDDYAHIFKRLKP